jgi:ribokinase
LNPAPALPLSSDVIALCDYLTPNEAEAAALVGHPVRGVDDAARAAETLLSRGARSVIITLGADGALVRTAAVVQHVPAFYPGTVVETTGAGDAFNGGLAVALSEGKNAIEATRFGCAVAGIAVTRPGTSQSMPSRREVESLLSR